MMGEMIGAQRHHATSSGSHAVGGVAAVLRRAARTGCLLTCVTAGVTAAAVAIGAMPVPRSGGSRRSSLPCCSVSRLFSAVSMFSLVGRVSVFGGRRLLRFTIPAGFVRVLRVVATMVSTTAAVTRCRLGAVFGGDANGKCVVLRDVDGGQGVAGQ